MAQLMPLPHTVSCFSKIQIGFTFLVPAHPEKVLLNGRVFILVFYSLLLVLTVLLFAIFWPAMFC